jgi:hypothetical protein
LVKSWKRLGIPIEFPEFEACTREQIQRVHDPLYVDGGIGPALELHNSTLIECHRVQTEN